MKNYFNLVRDYLLELSMTVSYSSEEEGIIVIKKEADGINNLILSVEDPILVFEHFIFNLPSENQNIAIELLKKNREIVHGAFVLDETGSKVIFRDTLQLENLDLNELEATINSLSMLFTEYSNEIIKFSKQ